MEPEQKCSGRGVLAGDRNMMSQECHVVFHRGAFISESELKFGLRVRISDADNLLLMSPVSVISDRSARGVFYRFGRFVVVP